MYEAQVTEENLNNLRTDFDGWYDNNPNDRTARNTDNCMKGLEKYIVDARQTFRSHREESFFKPVHRMMGPSQSSVDVASDVIP